MNNFQAEQGTIKNEGVIFIANKRNDRLNQIILIPDTSVASLMIMQTEKSEELACHVSIHGLASGVSHHIIKGTTEDIRSSFECSKYFNYIDAALTLFLSQTR